MGGYAPAPPMPAPKPVDMGPGPPPPPAPRHAPWRAVGWNERFFVMFGAMFGGIPTFIFAIMVASMGGPWNDWFLDSRGVTVDAEVMSVSPTNTTINDATVMEVKLRFEDAKGKWRKSTVYSVAAPAVGASIRIDYDPENVSRARIHGDSASPLGFLIFMPLVFGGIGFPMLFIGLWRARRQRSIYRRGTPAQARVVELTASASSENKRRVMIAHYHYQSSQGMHTGQLKSVSPPPRGSVIWVLYDPERPDQSIAA